MVDHRGERHELAPRGVHAEQPLGYRHPEVPGARPRVEAAIYDALTEANAAMGTGAAIAEPAIRASLDALPLDLP